MKPAQPTTTGQGTETASRTLQWVEQARAGDRVAFHRLVDRYQPEIFRMIYYRTRSQQDAEDLTQDVFLQAFRHLKRLQSTAVFRSWLYRIAVNKVRDHYRKKQFRALFGLSSLDEEGFVETPDMAVDPQADATLARREFWRQVEQAMQALSKMEREIFMLRFFDDLSIKEMTAALKKNESTVKTHLYRAMRKVKDYFADMDGILEGL